MPSAFAVSVRLDLCCCNAARIACRSISSIVCVSNVNAGAVDFATLATLDDVAYVIVSYISLTGTTFATASNLPAGYAIDYGYNGGTQIAVVQTVPEPSALAMLLGGFGVMGLLWRWK